MEKNLAINYDALESQRALEMQAEIQKQLAEHSGGGRIDSLRHTILRYVVEANYDKAHSELDRFVRQQDEYRPFIHRTKSYVSYCHDVINAIRAKRNLPGMGGMSMARNQELFEKVIEHFEELKVYLRKIEIVEKEVKIDDLRSTAWVVRALVHSVFIIVAVALTRSLFFGGLANTFNYVLDDMIFQLLNRFL